MQFGGQEFQQLSADQLFSLLLKKTTTRLVDKGDRGIRQEARDQISLAFDDFAITLFTERQRFLVLLASSDISDQAEYLVGATSNQPRLEPSTLASDIELIFQDLHFASLYNRVQATHYISGKLCR